MRHPLRRLPVPWLVAATVACGGAPPPAEEPVVAPRASVEPPAVATGDPRELPAGARYGDLVALVRRLDEARQGDSQAGCLLRPLGSGTHLLEADLSLGVRPLPDPPVDLDAALEAAPGPVRPLTPWGQVGDRPDGMLLAAVTSLPRASTGSGTVLLLTDRGVWARRTDRAVPRTDAGPVPLAEAAGLIRAVGDGGGGILVAAEAGVPIEVLATVLDALGNAAPVALAVPLPPDTVLPPGVGPRAAPAETDGALLCSVDGLPEIPEHAARGELRHEQVLEVIRSLRDGAAGCIQRSPAPPGSRMEVAFLIEGGGQVAAVCFAQDDARSAELRRCLADALRAMRFPAPGGPVEVRLPLVLGDALPRGLCGRG